MRGGGGKAEISKEVIGLCQKKGVWDTLKTRMMDFAGLGIRATLILTPWGIRMFIQCCRDWRLGGGASSRESLMWG